MFGKARRVFAAMIPCLFLPQQYMQPLQTTINMTLLVTALLAIVAVSLATSQGNRASRYFLVTWMPQVAFLVFRATQLLFVVPIPPWLEYGFPFTMAFSSIIITLGFADATLHARRERDIAHGLAERDGLTGVLNRRALTAWLANAVVDARVQMRSLMLLFLDIDHFKVINDRHGHLVSDGCLIALAETIGGSLKDGQTFGRYGGEELLVILPGASRTEAMLVGESLRRRIESMTIQSEGIPLRMTASIGIAHLLGDGDTVAQLVDRADQALYRAKARGRNRVAMYEPATTSPDA
jgi:diguanylate cyclase (GGDEF)-like protein